jgi:hypothetical protein
MQRREVKGMVLVLVLALDPGTHLVPGLDLGLELDLDLGLGLLRRWVTLGS